MVNSDQTVAASARLKFVENSLKAISSDNDKIVQGVKEVSGMLAEYRASLAKLIDTVDFTGQTIQIPISRHETEMSAFQTRSPNVRAISALVTIGEAANPQHPSAMTRTPNPNEPPSVMLASRSSFRTSAPPSMVVMFLFG